MNDTPKLLPELSPMTHPAIRATFSWFEFGHLPDAVAAVSAPFAELALAVATRSPNSPETTHALRALLTAKDCAVRAAIEQDELQAEMQDAIDLGEDSLRPDDLSAIEREAIPNPEARGEGGGE